ncbi:MAG: cysteine hydrolase, partial [bacterium]|nr:cysteine hydrolase [bacterium]
GLLIIDPQRSFTSGVWMRSIGANAGLEVAPIRLAFDNCAQMLSELSSTVETMFTRCPFPPGSYDWDERFDSLIKDSQPYFIKPGNSVMWPPTNGFREWVDGLLANDKNILVMGGCTLNSCVRVSAIDTMELFKSRGLQVVVDLSISGARTSNFTPSSQYGGLSSVESAILQMREAGVHVARHVTWR